MWFPQKERALATGLFNSGTNVGVMISFAHGLAGRRPSAGSGRSSRSALIGFVWLIFWQWGFDRAGSQPARVAGRTRLHPVRPGAAGQETPAVATGPRCCAIRQIWPFLIAKFLTDPVWWFYLYWLPSYLAKERGRNPLKSALLIALIYTGASCRLDCRRLVFRFPDRARLARRRRPLRRDAAAGRADAAVDRGLLHHQLRAVRRADQSGHRLPPGLVGQRVHLGDRSLPCQGLGLGGRPRSDDRRHSAACS